jgi:hypothetical protein
MPTIPTIPASSEDDLEIDLTDPTALDELLDARHASLFGQEHIVEWLRSSGGTLAERIMKQAAADLIEQQSAPVG